MKTLDHSVGNRRALGFTLVELLTVISIIGVLAALLVGLAPVASRKMKEARIQAELAQLVSGIESYKADVGYYPPDNFLVPSPGITNVQPAVNQLFYELTGTVVTNGLVAAKAEYRTVNGLSRLTPGAIAGVFHTPGFVNVSEDPKAVKNFLRSLRATQFKQVTVGTPPQSVLLLVVPVDLPKGVSAAPLLPPQLNPWRYNSSVPLHNTGRFDLWAEVRIGGRTNILGNWKD
jgi:prepilin-type N-terminal cleavage/methylation domain-containing protein